MTAESNTTRSFATGGPYGFSPGSPPPYSDMGTPVDQPDDEAQLSQYAGTDDTLNPAGWVGTDQWGGGGAGYLGRDVTDPNTWQTPNDVYAESGGMFSRLGQENGGYG